MTDKPKTPEVEKRKRAPGTSEEELDEMLLKSIEKGMHAYDGEPKRFKPGEGVEDATDDD